MLTELKNLHDFDETFPDEKACIDHYRQVRWPDGIACVHCGSMERVYDLKMGKHKCGDCGEKFTVRHGSIFADSKLSLRKWYKAVFLMTSHKRGISSCQLAKDVGVTQKTAWFILHRIRNATMTREFQARLTGTIECDEMFVGGRARWKHKLKKNREGLAGQHVPDHKPVLGMIQRDGELRFKRITGTTYGEIVGAITDNITYGSRVYTDEAAHYKWMKSTYAHALVRHTLDEYVVGDVTTNRIEGAFSHFKRTMTGTYFKISDMHLDRYLQAFAWRWNRRKMGEGERVNALLQATRGKQITYKQLIAKVEE